MNNENNNNLTLYEALQAIANGQAVTHRFFEPDEYLQQLEPGLFLLSGQWPVTEFQFFQDREGDQWSDGWSIYTGPLKN